jgi:hypothetical protein
MERLGPLARENTLEILKAEVGIYFLPVRTEKAGIIEAKRLLLSVASGILRS